MNLVVIVISVALFGVRAQLDADYNFAGEASYSIEVRLESETVSAGDQLKGVCVIVNYPNQNDFEFKITRGDDHEVLSEGATFSIPINKKEDLEDLSCEVYHNGNQDAKPFTAKFLENANGQQDSFGLYVKSQPRGSLKTALICQVLPKPENPGRFRYRWLSPNGRVIANGPIAMVPTQALSKTSSGGFVCESFDNVTREKQTAGLQNVPALRPTQAIAYIADIETYPKPPKGDEPYIMTVSIRPAPRGIITYTWYKNGAIEPMYTSNVYRINRLSASDVGSYRCVINFEDSIYGEQITLEARAEITGGGGGAASQDEEMAMEIVPKITRRAIGDSVEFHCKVSELEDPETASKYANQLTWRFERKIPGGPKFATSKGLVPLLPGWRTEVVGDSSYIRKSSITAEDEGFYFCRLSAPPGIEDYATLTLKAATSNFTFGAQSNGTSIGRCAANQRQCASGQGCYLIAKHCDGVRDCTDGSDEVECNCDPAIRTCLASRNGVQPKKQTYNVNWECDGEDDCGNNYDEEDCGPQNMVGRCPGNQRYTCKNSFSNKTIPMAYVCDGTKDCDNNDDESRCGTTNIMTSQKNHQIRRGDKITLECSAIGFPAARVIWRKNWRCLNGQRAGGTQTPYLQLPLPERSTVSSIVSDCERVPRVTSTLMIMAADYSDSAIYNCEALVGSKRQMSEDINVNIV